VKGVRGERLTDLGLVVRANPKGSTRPGQQTPAQTYPCGGEAKTDIFVLSVDLSWPDSKEVPPREAFVARCKRALVLLSPGSALLLDDLPA